MIDIDRVRKRPGMYIGDTTDGSGLHRMAFELVNNAIDEALAGHCSRIDVLLHADGSVTVCDNGRGISVDRYPGRDKSIAEILMTELHACWKLGIETRAMRGHAGGVGLAVVNAVSEDLRLRIWRHGVEHAMHFRRGEPEAILAIVGKATLGDGKPRHGTEITFTPDPMIFSNTRFDAATIGRHLHELAVGAAGTTISLADQRGDEITQTVYRN